MNGRTLISLPGRANAWLRLPGGAPEWAVPALVVVLGTLVDVLGRVADLADPFFCFAIALLVWQCRHRAATAVAVVGVVVGYWCEERFGAASGPTPLHLLAAAADLALYAGVALFAAKASAWSSRLQHALETAERHSFQDRLTGLPNRLLLLDRLSAAMAQARRSGSHLALMFLDLDRFKAVNDSFGHKAGDAVLKAVASRLQRLVRESDTVARLGGDEYVVLLTGLKAPQDAAAVADKIITAISAPIHVVGLPPLNVGASVGIATFPDDGTEIDRLLASADAAMYRSKERGRNCYTFATTAGQGAAGAHAWFAFDEKMTTRVAVMDQQHRHFFALAEGVNNSLRAGAPAAALNQRFTELMLYAKFHFATEERLMQESQYPGTELHCRLHAGLLRDLSRTLEREDDGAAAAALQTLKDWMIDHIESEDLALARHLQPLADGADGSQSNPAALPAGACAGQPSSPS